MRFHAMTWAEGSFDRSACVLSFDTKAARVAYRSCSAQRYEFINYRQKSALVREGYSHRLMLWDAAEPLDFVVISS